MLKPKIKVAVVEDRATIRRGLVRKINISEDLICVGEYNSAEDALVGISKNIPEIVVMDIGLPYMRGPECMLRLKAKHTNISFIMFTVFDQNEEVFNALKAGAEGYVLKSEGASGVVAAIRELHQGGAPMSQEIATKILASFHGFGPEHPLVESLNTRQMKILQYLSEGLPYKEIADKLVPTITVPGLKQNINRIYKKMQVNNRVEAMLKYFKMVDIGCPNKSCPMKVK